MAAALRALPLPRLALPLLALAGLGAASLNAAEISGWVFRDRNGNGLRDPGEEGIPSRVEVFGTRDAGGSVDLDRPTAGDGSFRLADPDLAPGCFAVRVSPPAGFRAALARTDCPGGGLGEPVGTRRYSWPRGLLGALKSNDLLHIALGDSIAEPASFCAAFPPNPNNSNTDYVGWFGQRLACVAPGARTENLAIGGWRVTNLLDPDPASRCANPNLPHGTPNPRCDNLYDTVARNPGLVTISIGGNDWLASEPGNQTEPFNPAEVRTSVEALINTRRNAQEVLSSLAYGLPDTDVIVNTVYDNRARSCASSDFHNIWIPIWNRMLREVVWGQGDRFQVAEVYPEYAHQDLNGAACCGTEGWICVDGIHPTVAGARAHLEKVWDAAGGVSLGPRDPLGTTTNPDLLVPAVELQALRFPSAYQDRTAGTRDPARALARDDLPASVPAGTGELVLEGFDATPWDIVPTQVVVVVRYRTDSIPPAPPEGDAYWFEASVDGTFLPPQYTVTGWNTVVPIVGAGTNAPVVNAFPDVPRYREARALLSRNLLDDGRQSGRYEFPALTWSDIATLRVRLRTETRGGGADAFRLEWDAAWLEVYGYRSAPAGFGIYRSLDPARIIQGVNQIGSAGAPPFDEPVPLPPAAPVYYYAVDEGAGPSLAVHLVKLAADRAQLSW